MFKKLSNIVFICISLLFSQNRDFPEFDIIVNDNSYSGDIFIHLMAQNDRYMGIIDSSLSIKWYI